MRIDPSRVVIVPKQSKWEYDQHRYNADERALLTRYVGEGMSQWKIDRIVHSHQRQKKNLATLLAALPEAKVLDREHVTKQVADGAQLVVAFGGDNHFQYVAQFMSATPILGINADPTLSDGVLLTVEEANYDGIRDLLNNHQLEYWTRLACRLNGSVVPITALAEIHCGEDRSREMSRHILELGARHEEQKGSGFLISSGAGSTGWYDSAVRYIHPEGNSFPRTADYARFLLREPHRGKYGRHSMKEGVLARGKTLTLHSLNDSNGIATLDCLNDLPFMRGAMLEVFLSDQPLHVMRYA